MSRSTPDPILEQAAQWYAEIHDAQVTDTRKRDWQAWLLASPEHREAWEHVERIDRQFADLPGPEARRALQSSGSRRRMLRGIAGLTLAAPVGWLFWQSPIWQADERTKTGEIRHLTLPDGSELWLNTASAVQLDFDAKRREIRLLAGEISISTAPDARPFSVLTPHGKLQPLGTRFQVRLGDRSTQVSVTQGRVAITPYDVPRTHTVDAGQTRTFTALGTEAPQTLAAIHFHWERGVLLADNTPLGDFLMELQRYRHGFIRWDTQVAEMRLVGAFPLDDTDRILTALEQTLPVEISHVTPWWVKVNAISPTAD